MTQIKAQIIEKKRYGSEGYLFKYLVPEIVKDAQPGQFVLVRCSERFDPLLRRPFSFHRFDKKQGTFDILFRVVGKGTALLAEKKVGETNDILGPLGNGFNLNKKFQNPILLAGGMGVAPILAVADNLVASGIKPLIFLGAKTKSELWYAREFEVLGCRPEFATDDGSLGFKGTVLELFKSEIRSLTKILGGKKSEIIIYGCGPEPMLKQLATFAQEKNFLCQLSLEANMACGLGACQGCVVQVNGPEKYKLVCKDGPVFDSKEIRFADEHRD
jgi:dihydroorotate dehydrogenase electron transfer subunit